MATIRTTTTSDTDLLGYDGPLPERLCAMAEDAVVGRNKEAVHAEAAVLRARLGLPQQEVIKLDDLSDNDLQAMIDAEVPMEHRDHSDNLPPDEPKGPTP